MIKGAFGDTRRRNDLIVHREINQRIAVILHLALDLRDEIAFRKMGPQFVHRGEAGGDFGFGSGCLNIHYGQNCVSKTIGICW